ncbi:hypothetical protein AB0M36_17945 [Actinoplanes sp. NPDC051346]|uniref:hypothetical protein n=1 Tax=Actinoplanes sp. NPDC051346 TaxID=3155048 RepID=UPI00343B89F9
MSEANVEGLVFRGDAVTGVAAGLVELGQSFRYLPTGTDAMRDCIVRAQVRGYDEYLNEGDGSFLVTAALQCAGLTAVPGATIAFVRLSADGAQAGFLYHEVAEGAEIPADARETSVALQWPGRGWSDSVRVTDEPSDPPLPGPAINEALRAIGAARGTYRDEAQAIGLA